MKVIYDSYAGQVAPVTYHLMSDSCYQFNPVEIDIRDVYYNAGGAPHFLFDGAYIANPWQPYDEWYAFVRHTVDSLLQIPSPISIEIEQCSDADSVYVSFDVTAVDSTPDDLRLYLAVVEYGHHYAYAHPFFPKKWFHIFRDFVPYAEGHPISLPMGSSLHFDWAYPIYDIFLQNHPGIECDSLDMITTVFVQNHATKEVVQAATVIAKAGVGRKHAGPLARPAGSLPNPLSSETKIMYVLQRPGAVKISIYTPAGRLVTHLVDDCLQPGRHCAVWNGRDRHGCAVGSGIYYYRLEAEGSVHSGKAVLVR
jgi:hypothetical protein